MTTSMSILGRLARRAALVTLDGETNTRAPDFFPMSSSRRMIFGPAVVQQSSTQMAAAELKGVCRDALTLGGRFANDPMIQSAVLHNLFSSTESQQMLKAYGVQLSPEEIHMRNAELMEELDFQHSLNHDMIVHADKLADDRSELRQRVMQLERENGALRQELEKAKQVQPAGGAQPEQAAAAEVQPLQIRAPAPQPRPRARSVRPRHRLMDDALDEAPSAILIQLALAVAAVVVALAVASKLPVGTVSSSMFRTASRVFGR